MSEATPNARTSSLSVASFALASIWYVGWGLTLIYALLSTDPQGWSWLPYIVLGMWGLPVMILSLLLGVWSIWCIRRGPQQLGGGWFAWTGVTLSLLAGPVWHAVPYIVVLLR